MTRLSVNINKIATLRNSRGGNIPNVLQSAVDCEAFGAQGITVHPRPDERHIKYQDVYDISKHIHVELNIEGYPSRRFLEMIKEVKPAQVTLVPDTHDVITSDSGWDTKSNQAFLHDIITDLNQEGIRVSVFVETSHEQIEYAAKAGAQRVELYTGPYAFNYRKDREAAIQPYIEAAKVASRVNLGLNSGHDLNLDNLRYYHENIPQLLEVSIGHALISDALYYGLENVIQMYLRLIK